MAGPKNAIFCPRIASFKAAFHPIFSADCQREIFLSLFDLPIGAIHDQIKAHR
jgi:hypothetical protein